MKTVDVNKEELLKIVTKNRESHVVDYQEMMEEYKKDVIKRLSKLLKEAKTTDVGFSHGVSNKEPENYESEYNRIISMLTMSVDVVITLSEHEYENYVLDDWSWSNGFNLSKSTYSKGY